MTAFQDVIDFEAVLKEVRQRYFYDAEFHACVDQAAMLTAKCGITYTMNSMKMGIALALVLKEHAPAWNPHPTTQRDKDLRLVSLAALGYIAYRERGETTLDLEIDLDELIQAMDRLCKTEET